MDIFLSDLTHVHLAACEVIATCACGHPIAGTRITEAPPERSEIRVFFADAYRSHLKTECASTHPQGHALLLSVKQL